MMLIYVEGATGSTAATTTASSDTWDASDTDWIIWSEAQPLAITQSPEKAFELKALLELILDPTRLLTVLSDQRPYRRTKTFIHWPSGVRSPPIPLTFPKALC